jgi:hypothetical protein
LQTAAAIWRIGGAERGNVLHFIGHGGFDAAAQEGTLALMPPVTGCQKPPGADSPVGTCRRRARLSGLQIRHPMLCRVLITIHSPARAK